MKDPIFTVKAPFRRGFRNCEPTFWHTSAISQHSDPHFAAVKRLRSIKNSQFRSQSPISQGVLQLRSIKTPNFTAKAPFRRVFCSCEMAAKHKNSQFHSQSSISQGISRLRNHFLAHQCLFAAPYTHFKATKSLLSCEMVMK